jgi:hypothetical protein
MQLHSAAARGDIEGIRSALAQGTQVDSRDSGGSTALMFSLHRAAAFDRVAFWEWGKLVITVLGGNPTGTASSFALSRNH